MKTILAVALVAATFAAFASSADARPHRVCYVRHHHRYCHIHR
jgi:hypothetical protein